MNLCFFKIDKITFLRFLFFVLLISSYSEIVFAQKKNKLNQEKDTLLLETNPNFRPTLEINPYAIEEEKKRKEKKRKKKVFYGIKTKVRYTKEYTRNRRGIIFRKVHVLKEPVKPNFFVHEVYFYDYKKKEIGRTFPDRYKPEMGDLLHGAYERTIDGILVERGIFYKGTKHGRWEKYGNDMELLGKDYYYRGHPKNSEITYYDIDQKKVKEIIPIHYGKKDGVYMAFFESGRMKEKGMYRDDIKVGRWYEYFDRDRSNNKKEMQYVNRNRPYEEGFEPYIIREWDEKGEKIVDNRRGRN